MTVSQDRRQHGLMQLTLFSGVPIGDKSCQRSAQDISGRAAEHSQGNFVAASDFAVQVGGQDGNPGAQAGIDSSPTQRFGAGTACVGTGSRRRLRMRIEIGRWHSARLELILTQRTDVAETMPPGMITKVTGYLRKTE